MGEIVDDVMPEREESVDSSIRRAFEKTFGDNWQSLPIRSLEGAIAVYILDQVLSPHGITPRVLAMSALDLADRMEFEVKFRDFLDNISKGGSLSLGLVKSLGENMGGTMKEAFSVLEAGFIVGTDLAAKTFKKGAKGLKGLVGKLGKTDEAQE